MHNLSKNAEFRRLKIDGTNYILAAGTTDVDSEIVDTLGYEAICFVYGLGTLAASSGVTIQVQQNTANSSSGMADLAGSEQATTADTDDNKLIISDPYRPTERYLRVQTIRGDGGNSTIDFLIAILYRAGQLPVTQGATVLSSEAYNSPAEGTA